MIYNEKYRTLLTDINFDEETTNKSKINNIASTENSNSNRSNAINIIKNLEKNKINDSKANKHWNHLTCKKLANFKKNNLNLKKITNFQKFPILNIKDIIGNSNFMIKTEPNCLKYQEQINSQRNKPNGINANKKLSSYYYLNSARISNKKSINNSYHYNFGSNNYLENLTEYNPFLNNNLFKLCKIKTSINNIRNKKRANNDNQKSLNRNYIYNITNDDIKNNTSKNKSLFNSNIDINSLILNKIINNNKNNIFLDKTLVSKKLLASLRKKTNLKSILINNIFDKKLNDKTKKNSVKSKVNENKNKLNNNSAIINYPKNVKKIKSNNNFTENRKLGNKFIKIHDFYRFKTELLFNSLKVDKTKHKKIKSMKEAIGNMKSKNTKKFSNTLLNK